MHKKIHRFGGLAPVIATVLLATSAHADQSPSTEQLLQLIQQQQKQLDELKAMLAKTQKQSETAVARAEAAQEAPKEPSILDRVQIGGLIEVEASTAKSFANANTSDIRLGKVELFVDTQPTDWVSTYVQFIFEDGDTNIKLDEAFAVLGNTEKFPLFVQGGQWAMPFGYFETAMSTDPLTKNLGETKEGAVLVGGQWGGFALQGYAYNGDTQRAGKQNGIDQGGFFAGYIGEAGEVALDTGVGYISNMGDSDGLTTGLGGNATALVGGYVAGFNAHAAATWDAYTLRGSYMTALASFDGSELTFNGSGAKPKAWHAEANYTQEILGKETIFAATAQGTREALALGLPEYRYGGAVTVVVLEHAAVTAEYLHDEDYAASKGGTGESGHTGTVKLAVDF